MPIQNYNSRKVAKAISICRMKSYHVKQVTEIEYECKLGHWSWTDYLDEIKRNDSIILVALTRDSDRNTENNKPYENVIGFLTSRLLIPYKNSEFNSYGKVNPTLFSEADLINIGVRIKFREMGIGSLLLKSFFEATQIRQVKSVWLEVRESNFKAIKFYLREGFSFIQTRKNFYSNPSENAKIMKCDLSGHLAEDNR